MRELAAGLRVPKGPVAMADGSVLVVQIARGTLARVRPDGRTDVVDGLPAFARVDSRAGERPRPGLVRANEG